MKLTKDQAIEALKAVGVADAVIVDEPGESDFNTDAFLSAVDGSRAPVLTPKIKQQLREEVNTSIAGMVGSQLEAALKKNFGVDTKQFTPEMKDAQKIELAIQHYMTTIDKSKEDVRSEIAALTSRLSEEKESLKTDYETRLASANERYISRDMEAYYMNKLAAAPIPATADKAFLAAQLLKHMKENYHVAYDENGKAVQYFNKDKKDLPALNKAGNSLLSDDEEIKGFLTKAGVWQTSTAAANPATAMAANGTAAYVPPGVPNPLVASGPSQSLTDLNKQRSDYIASKAVAAGNPSV